MHSNGKFSEQGIVKDLLFSFFPILSLFWIYNRDQKNS